MNWELSQKTKTLFDIVRAASSFLVVAGFALYLIAVSQGDKNLFTAYIENHKGLALLAGIILIVGIFPGPYIFYGIQRLRIIIKNRSNYIIENQHIYIDITNEGKTAFFHEETEFCKIGKGKYKNYDAHVRVSGTIVPSSKLNCNYEWPDEDERNDLALNYSKNQEKKSSAYNTIVRKHNPFLMFSASLENTFTEAEEYWGFLPKHYCRNYYLQILLPENCILKKVGIYKIIDGNKIPYDDSKPIKTKQNGRHKIIMKLVDIDAPNKDTVDKSNGIIRLYWVWEFTKN